MADVAHGSRVVVAHGVEGPELPFLQAQLARVERFLAVLSDAAHSGRFE